MTEKQRKGPSLAALAALATLAITLWFDVELSMALFRAVLVYLGMSLLALVYRIILGHYLTASQERAQQALLERVQREAEQEAAKADREAATSGKKEVAAANKERKPPYGQAAKEAKGAKIAEEV